MKFHSKICLLTSSVLIVTVAAIIAVGTFIIDGTVNQFTRELLLAKISLLNQELIDVYNELKLRGEWDNQQQRAIAAKDLLAKIQNFDVAKTSRVDVYDSKHQYLLGNSYMPQDTANLLLDKSSGYSHYIGKDKSPMYCVYMTNRDWGWLLVLSISESELLQKRNDYLRMTSLVGFAILIIALFVSYQYSGKIASRISDIVDCVKSIGKGELNHKINLPDDASEEFKILQNGLNGMVASLRERETERELAQGERQKHQKLEAIGVLAGGIAHDFNNLLTAVLGNLQLALMKANRDDVKSCLCDGERATLKAMDLTQQLLTFSKGGVPIKKTVRIQQVLKKTVNFSLSGTKTKAVFEFDNALDPVDIDIGQVSQAIQSIVINANQAMAGGGTVHVTGKSIKITKATHLPLEPGEYVEISITDQGEGIAQEHQKRVFDPFFTTKPEGSGLGLATAYSIINKHKGHITLRSELGMGATFILYLPVSTGELIEQVQPEDELFHKNKRVLIMDDQEVVRTLFGKLLMEMGCDVEFAEEGEEAISLYKEAIKSKPFDLVIIDLTIPGGLGGKETIEKLLEIDPSVTAVVSSGYSNDPIMANFAQFGFKERLVKPFTLQDLSGLLKTLFT